MVSLTTLLIVFALNALLVLLGHYFIVLTDRYVIGKKISFLQHMKDQLRGLTGDHAVWYATMLAVGPFVFLVRLAACVAFVGVTFFDRHVPIRFWHPR